jgi:hypothetical protein
MKSLSKQLGKSMISNLIIMLRKDMYSSSGKILKWKFMKVSKKDLTKTINGLNQNG